MFNKIHLHDFTLGGIIGKFTEGYSINTVYVSIFCACKIFRTAKTNVRKIDSICTRKVMPKDVEYIVLQEGKESTSKYRQYF